MSSMRLETSPAGFTLSLDGRTILKHDISAPCVFVGRGQDRIEMHLGRFEIEDRLVERCPLTHAVVEGARILLSAGAGQAPRLILAIDENSIVLETPDRSINRFWIRIVADPDEHVWGGGEQFSYFDLRGRRFPLWSSEPG